MEARVTPAQTPRNGSEKRSNWSGQHKGVKINPPLVQTDNRDVTLVFHSCRSCLTKTFVCIVVQPPCVVVMCLSTDGGVTDSTVPHHRAAKQNLSSYLHCAEGSVSLLCLLTLFFIIINIIIVVISLMVDASVVLLST